MLNRVQHDGSYIIANLLKAVTLDLIQGLIHFCMKKRPGLNPERRNFLI